MTYEENILGEITRIWLAYWHKDMPPTFTAVWENGFMALALILDGVNGYYIVLFDLRKSERNMLVLSVHKPISSRDELMKDCEFIARVGMQRMPLPA